MVRNYSQDRKSEENYNIDDKYSVTGESEFSRESTVPFDQDEILSERHYTFGPLELHGRKLSRSREPETEPTDQRRRLVEKNYRGRGPKGYRRSDESIKEDVSEALYRCSEVDASEIEVFVSQGTVTLKGFVNDREQKRSAENAVEYLSGVEDIFNELRVKNQRSSEKSRFGLTNNITGLN